MKTFGSFLLAALLLAVAQVPRFSQAGMITAVNVSGGGTFVWPRTLGWAFQTSQPIQVDSLGVFDSNNNGLESAVGVGIWRTSDEQLLASVTIPVGTGAPLDDGFRYQSITPITLVAGTEYRIGAVALSGLIPFLHAATATLAPELSLVGNGVQENANVNALVFPAQLNGPGSEDRYFGPNFQFGGTAIPEPSTLVLMGIGGMALLCSGRRRKAA